jgi:hypothetical protein
MAKTSYSTIATRPEELTVCSALESGDYTKLYADRVVNILENISDRNLRDKVRQTLGSFEERDGRLAQSSPYRLVVLNEILPKGKVLVARPRLEAAKVNDPNFMSGFYVDCGLNLVSGEEGYKINPVQAQVLANDLEHVGVNLTNPKLVPYKILQCQADANSSSGLVFRLNEQGKDTAKASILKTQDFNWDYFPSQSGLFRAFLYWSGNWGADVDGLADSNDGGRVVVETSGEASAKNFDGLRKQTDALLARQRQERDDLIKRLQA